MRQVDSGDRADEDVTAPDGPGPDDSGIDDLDSDEYDDDGTDIDWIVFLFRAAAVVTFGATLIVSIDLSRNRGGEWIEVMRLAILPVIGSMLLLAAGELLDRRGD